VSTAPRHPDLEKEQAFLNHAYACLDAMRHRATKLGDAGGDKKASAALRKLREEAIAKRTHREGVCFGRIDLMTDEKHYVGRQGIRDADNNLIVINWQAPAAEPFYTATPDEPAGLELRRRFRTEGERLVDILDEVFGQVREAEPTMDDVLLAELGRERTAEMRDIVETIQREQYRLISLPLNATTVVQGGPGTGKTAVGLHRAAWLLYRYRDDLAARRVLVVGPNRLFMRYISYVLPSLGETAALQYSIEDLSAVRAAGDDQVMVARIKGDHRMAKVLRRAVADRVRPPSEDLRLEANGIRFVIPRDSIADLVSSFDARGQAYLVARDRFRARFERLVVGAYDAAAARPGSSARPTPIDIRSMPEFDRALDRIWQTITAPELVRQLLSSEERLERAAGDVLGEIDRRLLYRKPVERIEQVPWTVSDLPLVDEVEHLLSGRTSGYGHVILDEAQDLTPMQLRAIARRVRDGSITVLGDLAQATGVWRYTSWEEIAEHLGVADTVSIEELTLAYRVPRAIMDVALPVLRFTAPSIEPPVAYRPSGERPEWHEVERRERVEQAIALAVSRGDRGGSTALIAPGSLIPEIRAELAERGLVFGDAESGELETALELLDPVAAKGLEFDHVILVEPAAMIREAGEGQGHRELYVALTRATRSLACVHAEPLPWPLGEAELRPPSGEEPTPATDSGGPPVEPEAAPAPSLTAAGGLTLSEGEALILARTRGLDLDEALARVLVVRARGGAEDEASSAALDLGAVPQHAIRSVLDAATRAANGADGDA
jgi:DNA helicase IV